MACDEEKETAKYTKVQLERSEHIVNKKNWDFANKEKRVDKNFPNIEKILHRKKPKLRSSDSIEKQKKKWIIREDEIKNINEWSVRF